MKGVRFIFIAICLVAMLPACAETEQPVKGKILIDVVSTQTKSAEITTKKLEDAGQFVMDAWLDDDYYDRITDPAHPVLVEGRRHHIISNGTGNVSYSSLNGWNLVTEYDWVSDLNTRFWCYAPVSTKGDREVSDPAAPAADDLNFTYSMSEPGTTVSGKHIDADNCDDIIFAYVKQQFTGSNDKISILFLHAMSQIEFCISTDDQTFDKTLKLKSISLSNVYKSGSCTFSGPGRSFSWSYLPAGSPETATFVQDYDISFYPEEPEPEDGWISGSYSSDGKTYNPFSSTNNFFFIPQDNSTKNVQIQAVFDDNGTIITTDPVTINDIWEPGYYYKYKLKATTVGRYIQFTVSLIDWINFDDKLII